MDKEQIRLLLDKYYAGKTDFIEEAHIMGYLSQDDIPADMEADRELFDRLYGIAEAHGTAGIERRMARQAESWNRIERSTTRRERRLSLRWMSGIAASLLILTTIGMLSMHNNGTAQTAQEQDNRQTEYTKEEIEQAKAVTELALMKFSKSMNEGLDALGKHNN